MRNKEPKEKNPIMEETKKKIIKNSIVAILILFSFIGIFVAFSIAQNIIFSRVWQIITMVVLGASIVIFEIAYKKDSGILAITGIEVLLFACYLLTIEYINLRFGFDIKTYIIIAGVIFFIYYLLKILLIYTKGRKNVLNSLSDIAEIIKEDKPKKKEAVKRKKGEGEKND